MPVRWSHDLGHDGEPSNTQGLLLSDFIRLSLWCPSTAIPSSCWSMLKIKNMMCLKKNVILGFRVCPGLGPPACRSSHSSFGRRGPLDHWSHLNLAMTAMTAMTVWPWLWLNISIDMITWWHDCISTKNPQVHLVSEKMCWKHLWVLWFTKSPSRAFFWEAGRCWWFWGKSRLHFSR